LLLLLVALLPRVGRTKHDGHVGHDHRRRDSTIEVTPRDRFARDTDAARTGERVTIGDRPNSRIVAPAEGTTPESRETTRRERNG
jgi:hypothetical protein